MDRLRCLFAKNDDLHEFADKFLRYSNFFSMLASGSNMWDWGDATVCRLHTAEPFQVELVTVRGGYYIPPHVHPHMDSIEVNLSGAVRFVINGDDVFENTTDERLLQRMHLRGIRIDHNDIHHGQVLPCGACFLSFQKWHKPATSVGLDYKGTPLNELHQLSLAQAL